MFSKKEKITVLKGDKFCLIPHGNLWYYFPELDFDKHNESIEGHVDEFDDIDNNESYDRRMIGWLQNKENTNSEYFIDIDESRKTTKGLICLFVCESKKIKIKEGDNLFDRLMLDRNICGVEKRGDCWFIVTKS